MADKTSIEWCHATINAISGCAPCSPGCANCYAMRAGAFGRPHHPVNGLTRESKAGHVWTGAVRFNEEWLRKPLAWKKPRRIFWNAHGDPFFEPVPVEWVDQEVAIAALTPQHRHILLSKRTARMRAYFSDPETPERVLATARHLAFLPERFEWPLPNLWLGTSVEDQARADERGPDLLKTPAALRFLSCEPLLGLLDLEHLTIRPEQPCWRTINALSGEHGHGSRSGFTSTGVFDAKIDWVIVGGESGTCARAMHPDWVRSLRDQCIRADVPFLFKQWGEWSPRDWRADLGTHAMHREAPDYGVFQKIQSHPNSIERTSVDEGWQAFAKIGKSASGRLLDGVLHDTYPEIFKWEKRESARV